MFILALEEVTAWELAQYERNGYDTEIDRNKKLVYVVENRKSKVML